MNPSIELLKEIIKMFEDIYSSSGYGQMIIYAANENGTQNWYWKAKKLIAESEK
jgi:hypothetical protein